MSSRIDPSETEPRQRKTVATTETSPAPLQILLYTLPIWGASLILTFFMPITGIFTSFILAGCILILPFTARKGPCPQCDNVKILPFNGFGNCCKGCGEELVLRDGLLHQLEPKRATPQPGSGRSNSRP